MNFFFLHFSPFVGPLACLAAALVTYLLFRTLVKAEVLELAEQLLDNLLCTSFEAIDLIGPTVLLKVLLDLLHVVLKVGCVVLLGTEP